MYQNEGQSERNTLGRKGKDNSFSVAFKDKNQRTAAAEEEEEISIGVQSSGRRMSV
jgi:hypothetical protein